MTVYAWSDRWQNAGAEVLDWDFGLIDRDGNAKPALSNLKFQISNLKSDSPFFSIIVCTRNGNSRIGDCLTAIGKLTGGGFETIVVDDGSTDGTGGFRGEKFPVGQAAAPGSLRPEQRPQRRRTTRARRRARLHRRRLRTGPRVDRPAAHGFRNTAASPQPAARIYRQNRNPGRKPSSAPRPARRAT